MYRSALGLRVIKKKVCRGLEARGRGCACLNRHTQASPDPVEGLAIYPESYITKYTRIRSLEAGDRGYACITQLKDQGPSRTCNESKEKEEGLACLRICSEMPGSLDRRPPLPLSIACQSQFEDNYFTEMCSGSEAGTYLRLTRDTKHEEGEEVGSFGKVLFWENGSRCGRRHTWAVLRP